MRYLRAFLGAARMTLRGEKIAQPDPALLAWWHATPTLVDAVEAAAAVASVDLQTFTLRIEGRDTSAATILSTIRFHAATEYPHLFRREAEYAMLGMQATNYNDRFLVLRLGQDDRLPDAVRAEVERLGAHLQQTPSINARSQNNS